MYFVCTFDVRPESRSALLESLERLVEHARTEAGTLQYEVLTDRENPQRVIVFERYTDAAALEAHLGSAPVSAVLARFGDYLSAPPTLVRAALRSGFVRAGLDNQL